MCSVFSLTQLVTQPTRRTQTTANILDLVLTSRPDLASSITYLPSLSDHSLLSFNINLPRTKYAKKSKVIRNYKKANFEAINSELCAFLDPYLADFDKRDVQSNWNMFVNKVTELTERHIPSFNIFSDNNAPWYNLSLKRLSNKKKRLYRSAKASTNNDRWAAYKLASNEYISALKHAKENFLNNTLPSLLTGDTKKFWRIINPPNDETITLTSTDGNVIPPEQCAAALNNAFTENFSKTSYVPLPNMHQYDYVPMFPITVDAYGVENVIKSLK